MIVAIGGKMGAGKSTIAEALNRFNFIKISFADHLKKVISELYDIPIEDLYDHNKKDIQLEKSLYWNYDFKEKLESIIQEKIYLPFKIQKLNSIREVLQFIGTDILRSHDYNYHVKNTISRIKKNNNYVIDDCRFLSEVEALRQKGAILIYILRNGYKQSDHISENEVHPNHFDYVVDNNSNDITHAYNAICKIITMEGGKL